MGVNIRVWFWAFVGLFGLVNAGYSQSLEASPNFRAVRPTPAAILSAPNSGSSPAFFPSPGPTSLQEVLHPTPILQAHLEVPAQQPGLMPLASTSGAPPWYVPTPAATANPRMPPTTMPYQFAEPVNPEKFRQELPSRLSFFPNGLLWEPLLANKRDPRFALVVSDLNTPLTSQTADTSIGTTFGLFRFSPWMHDVEMQLDMFGVVHSRFSQADFLIASDYRFGVPLTFRIGNFHAKLAYEHTSTHFGDEAIEISGLRRIEYIRDEFVLGLGYTFANQLRIYGQYGYSSFIDVIREGVRENNRNRYDVGLEWFRRQKTLNYGQPFAALNLGFDGVVNFDPDLTLQAGWMWRLEDRRLSQVRLYAEFYTGRSPYGQLFRDRETFSAVGVSLDY